LGLDKWIKTEETKGKKIYKKDEGDPDKKSDSKPKDKHIGKDISKFDLTCSNAKCKYKKTIVKKNLSEKDKICPRCKSEMKIK
jgi:hypothetical protein